MGQWPILGAECAHEAQNVDTSTVLSLLKASTGAVGRMGRTLFRPGDLRNVKLPSETTDVDRFPVTEILLPEEARFLTSRVSRECHNSQNVSHVFAKNANNIASIPQTTKHISQRNEVIRKRQSRAITRVKER